MLVWKAQSQFQQQNSVKLPVIEDLCGPNLRWRVNVYFLVYPFYISQCRIMIMTTLLWATSPNIVYCAYRRVHRCQNRRTLVRSSQKSEAVTTHALSELTNVLYLLALVILTLFSLVDTITEGSWHLSFIYYWLTHSLFLLLLAQLHRLDTTAHEQIAMEVGAGWKPYICHFQQGVRQHLNNGDSV